MAISYRLVGNLGGGGYYFSPEDAVKYKLPTGQYEVFAYRDYQARQIQIKHSKDTSITNVISSYSGGVTTPEDIEWIQIWGASKALIMPVDQLDKRVPEKA